MKRYYQIRLFLLIPLFISCNEFLEEAPDDRVDLNTLPKAAQLLTNAYSQAAYNFTEWMSDNVTYTFGTIIQPEHEEAYNWEEFSGFFQDTPTYYWNAAYEAIAHANEVLAVVDELPGDEARRRAVKGEALLTRAYHHFMLVNLFARHYRGNSDRDRGIPYVEEPERVFVKQYERNTVEEVYDKIEEDLQEGLELIDDQFYANSGKYHFTRNAALGFASRFYLFKGDYNNCIQYSSELLGDEPGSFVKNLSSLLQNRTNTEDYVRLYNSPTDDSNLLLMRKITSFHVNVGHWPDGDLYNYFGRVNPYGATDLRFESAYVRGENGISLPKFEFLFERSSLTSNVGLNYTIVVPLRGEEVLLNRAESYVITNQVDEALEDLQALADRRYEEPVNVDLETLRPFYSPIVDDRIIVLAYILDERQKEFLHEGLRWFDIRRYDFPVFHVQQDGQSVATLEPDDPRKILQIPQSAIDVGGLEPNDR